MSNNKSSNKKKYATPFLTILCTVPDYASAQKIARNVVEEKLAACCNILPEITSIYHWENKIQEESEFLLIIKSRRELFPKLARQVKKLHPYTVPEIIAIPVINGNEEYLKWMEENVKRK